MQWHAHRLQSEPCPVVLGWRWDHHKEKEAKRGILEEAPTSRKKTGSSKLPSCSRTALHVFPFLNGLGVQCVEDFTKSFPHSNIGWRLGNQLAQRVARCFGTLTFLVLHNGQWPETGSIQKRLAHLLVLSAQWDKDQMDPGHEPLFAQLIAETHVRKSCCLCCICPVSRTVDLPHYPSIGFM